MLVAGSLGGVYKFEYDVISGLLAGYKAAEYLGKNTSEKVIEYKGKIREMLNNDVEADRLFGSIYRMENVYPSREKELYRDKSNVIICRCVDVSLEDVDHSIERMGTNDIEILKRYSGILTGRCQGKLCLYNLHKYLHVYHGRLIKSIHHRIRPPYTPHPLFYLEAGIDEI